MRKPLTAAAALLAAAVVLTACSGNNDGDTTANASASDAESVGSLTLGWVAGAGGAQVALAEQDGLWADEGLDTTVNTFATGREALESLLGGGIDVAVLGELPVVTSATTGNDTVIIDRLTGYGNYRIIGNKSSGITEDASSIDGKKLGTTLGTNMQFMAEEFIEDEGIQAELVNAAPADLVSALARGDVDAAVMFESFYGGAEDTLGDDYVEIPVSAEIYTGSQVVAVSQATIDSNPEAVQALVDGLLAASKIAQNDADAGQAAVLEAVPGGLTAEYLASIWDDYDFTSNRPTEITSVVEKQVEWLKRQDRLSADFAVDDTFLSGLLDDQFVEAGTK